MIRWLIALGVALPALNPGAARLEQTITGLDGPGFADRLQSRKRSHRGRLRTRHHPDLEQGCAAQRPRRLRHQQSTGRSSGACLGFGLARPHLGLGGCRPANPFLEHARRASRSCCESRFAAACLGHGAGRQNVGQRRRRRNHSNVGRGHCPAACQVCGPRGLDIVFGIQRGWQAVGVRRHRRQLRFCGMSRAAKKSPSLPAAPSPLPKTAPEKVAIRAVAFSPDGKTIYLGGADGNILVVN